MNIFALIMITVGYWILAFSILMFKSGACKRKKVYAILDDGHECKD